MASDHQNSPPPIIPHEIRLFGTLPLQHPPLRGHSYVVVLGRECRNESSPKNPVCAFSMFLEGVQCSGVLYTPFKLFVFASKIGRIQYATTKYGFRTALNFASCNILVFNTIAERKIVSLTEIGVFEFS